MNWELPDIQTRFSKGRGTRDQIALDQEKARNSRKTSASLTEWKPLTVWITTNCGKFLKRWEYQTTSPVSWETYMPIKKQQLEPDTKQQTGSKLRKEYVKAFLSPCLFKLCAEYIMQNAGLDDSQAGIKIARRNINNLGYVDDTTLMQKVNRN